MDLFDQASNGAQMPLAARMRPESLDHMVGQQHLLSCSAVLRRAIERDTLPSVILQGPAGSGKTTLAQIIANCTQRHFESLSGVSATVSDFRKSAEAARQRRKLHDQETIVFLDEIHRLSKTPAAVANKSELTKINAFGQFAVILFRVKSCCSPYCG